MIRKIAFALGGVFAVLVFAGAVFAAMNATLLTRHFTRDSANPVHNLDWYSPTALIKGKPGASLPVAEPAARTIEAQALAAARDYVGQFESVSLLVWHRGAVQLEHYWPGFGPDTVIGTASMHKSVLALMVGIAIDRGVLPSVTTPAATWIEDWREDERRGITLQHLLWMSSGLDPVTSSGGVFSAGTRLLLGTHINKAAISLPLTAEPATRFAYSNASSQILGHVLEQASGRDYEDLLEEWLWSRLGTGDARLWMDRKGGTPRTYCCLQITARDWLRIGLLILNEGRVGEAQIVPADWIAEMATPAPTNPNYGYQVWLGSPHAPERRYGPHLPDFLFVPAAEPFAREDVVYFDGSGAQRVYIIPSEQIVIVRTGVPTREWDDSYLPNLLIEGILPPGQPVDDEDGDEATENEGNRERGLGVP